MEIKMENSAFNLFNNSLIKDITLGDVKLNLLTLSEIDTPLINVYVRKNEEVIALLDNTINMTANICENGIQYVGTVRNIEFTVSFIFNETTMKVNVELSEELEIIYTQDIGINGSGNTLYASQYIDNRVYENVFGYNVCMRRTQKTPTGFTFIQVGSLDNKVVKYVTEGMDFFTTNFRKNKEIKEINLTSRERNYEMSFVALEVDATKNACFYAYVESNMEEAISGLKEAKNLETNIGAIKSTMSSEAVEKLSYINGLPTKHNDLIDPEYSDDNQLLAYFTKNHAHVVLPLKEVLVDRQHANIITSKTGDKFNTEVLVSSNYMGGIFWAQNAISNTQLNAMNKNIASYLDFNKTEGLRIYVDGQMLNMPSFYEVGFNYSKWVYALENNTIEVKVYTSVYNTNVKLEVNTTNPVEIKMSDSLNDFMQIEGKVVTPKVDSFQMEKQPNLKYEYFTESKLNVKENLVTFNFGSTTSATIELGTSTMGTTAVSMTGFEEEVSAYKAHFNSLLNNLEFSIEGEEASQISSFNHLLYWYLHNGLIHFATPHGVEQHGGAAWGTRDVCQGPVELFSTLGKHEIVREILIKLFDNQFVEDGNWPQWFMFDSYDSIRPDESHGDIIAWPIKALGEYLANTGDLSILDETCGYYHHKTMKRSETVETVYEHVKKEINYIIDNFIDGTYISAYGEGDWDDTLQPANSSLRKRMASGWTVPLTYQGILAFSGLIKDYDAEYSSELEILANNIKDDYRKYFIKDGVVAGFIYINDVDNVEYMLHPSDVKTGIQYRLLPINRGIITGIFTEEEKTRHLNIIDEHLKCPDGVRLMNRPVRYDGGREHIFQRGESASTVGREISLQYVHAHIRYIEAMTKLNEGKRAYEGLRVISPFNIRKNVKNAAYRQSNSYFSSSEGDVNNRYEYANEFDKLRDGSIPVRGGWRIYSSGPGIYLYQLLTSYLGLKLTSAGIEINSAVGSELAGLSVKFNHLGKAVTVKYSGNVAEAKFIANEEIIENMEILI